MIEVSTGAVVSQLVGCCAAESGYTQWNPVNDWVATFVGTEIHIQNGRTGNESSLLFDPEASGWVSGIAWNADGTKLASTTTIPAFDASAVPQIQIWDTTTLLEINQSPMLRFDGGGSFVLAWSPDSTQIASNKKGGVIVYDAATGQEIFQLETGKGKAIHDVAWSPDGSQIAAMDRQLVWVWDSETQQIIKQYPITGLTSNLAWSPDSTHLYYGGSEGVYRDGLPLADTLNVNPTPTP